MALTASTEVMTVEVTMAGARAAKERPCWSKKRTLMLPSAALNPGYAKRDATVVGNGRCRRDTGRAIDEEVIRSAANGSHAMRSL